MLMQLKLGEKTPKCKEGKHLRKLPEKATNQRLVCEIINVTPQIMDPYKCMSVLSSDKLRKYECMQSICTSVALQLHHFIH